MYLRAGLLDALDAKEGHSVPATIAADPDLTNAQKQSLTQIYETFRRDNARPAPEPSAPTEASAPADTAAGRPTKPTKPKKKAAGPVAADPEEIT